MKRIAAFILPLFFFTTAFPQHTYYAAAKAGLSIREQPGTGAKILDKIPYGEKVVTVAGDANQPAISTEGFNGFWWKANYNGKTGYIVSSYVLPLPAPGAGIKTLNDYFAQVSTASGPPLVIKQSDSALNEMGESTLTKYYYKNGMEWHKWEGYESTSELSLLPGFTMEQCFLLVRLIGQYTEVVTDKDGFPVKSGVIKKEAGNKTIEVQREIYDGKPGPVNKIKIISEQGAITEFEIYMLQTQAVIHWSSGV